MIDPVFFASECGGGTGTGDSRGFVGSTSKTARGSAGDDLRTCSIGAAVQFAKSNNLLGIFIDADLLVCRHFQFLPCPSSTSHTTNFRVLSIKLANRLNMFFSF